METQLENPFQLSTNLGLGEVVLKPIKVGFAEVSQQQKISFFYNISQHMVNDIFKF